ncbi:DUF3500 domain-containing protein [Streptomyces sp. NPDC002144]
MSKPPETDLRHATQFRHYVPAPDDPRVAGLQEHTARTFAEARLSIPVLAEVARQWRESAGDPYVGITTDGRVRHGVYELGAVHDAERPPTEAMLRAVEEIRRHTTQEQWQRLTYPLDAPEWRTWSNPEVLLYDNGLRLEEVSDQTADALLGLVRATLSEDGYAVVGHLMQLNGFLGELTGMTGVMNPGSYQFAIFGEPSLDQPWGWHLYGHHVCVNALVAGDRMAIGPVFLGAEPDSTDVGPEAGVRPLVAREQVALSFINSLTPSQLSVARSYPEVRDPRMPEGRVHPVEERFLAGAFQDNRVIPVEGICATELDDEQQRLLLDVIEQYSVLLPEGPRAARMREVRAHLPETYLTWIGGIDDEQPFYYRVQSPVVLVEFDHHAGMYLTNPAPARFHIHTILRLPNGNDYGRLLWKPLT